MTMTRAIEAQHSHAHVPAHVPTPAAEIPAATSRFTSRWLEHAALQARLRSNPADGAGAATAIDTVWLVDAIAPLLDGDAPVTRGAARGACAVRRMLLPRGDGRTLAIDVTPATIGFDASDLARLLRELVDNALRHSAPGTTIRVRGAPGAGGYQLSVTNAGAAMPRWTLALLRAPRGERADGGPTRLALGLSLASALASLNGTRLEALRSAGRPNTLRLVIATR